MKFKIFKFKKVTSTNDKAINLITKKRKLSGYVNASVQTKGRGTYGKKWISKKGNFFGTVFFHLKKKYPSINEFTLINPILNINILSKYCGKRKTFFKSPNDIYVNKKKICGILQEVITKGSKKYLIIGIGINILSNPKTQRYLSTNIYKETKKKPNMSVLLNQIVKNYENFFLNLNFYKYSNYKIKSEKFNLQ